jgi:hypothetical protein
MRYRKLEDDWQQMPYWVQLIPITMIILLGLAMWLFGE